MTGRNAPRCRLPLRSEGRAGRRQQPCLPGKVLRQVRPHCIHPPNPVKDEYLWGPRGKSESENHLVLLDSLWPHGLHSPWNSPGQNTGVGRLSLLQGIFLTRELNLGLLHCRWILYQLNYQGSLEAKAALFLLSVNTQYRKPFRWRVVSERALVESSGLTVGP